MTVELYIHTELPNDVKERQATLAAARLLHEHFYDSPEVYFFIVNIEPKREKDFAGLTQLDAVLLGPRFITLLDFKNCFTPVIASDLETPWYTYGGDGMHQLFAGQNVNPFQQVRHARDVWSNYLRRSAEKALKTNRANQLRSAYEKGDAWSHLSACILFHPHLHPDSQIPPLEKAYLWCHLASVDKLIALTFIIESNRLVLTTEERLNITRELFHARPWIENRLELHDFLGYLYVQEPGLDVVRYPLRSYEEFVIGRSRMAANQGHQVAPQLTTVSSLHARLETDGRNVYLYDTGSKNGTFVNGRRLAPAIPTQLENKMHMVTLGPPDTETCKLWYIPEVLPPSLPTITVS